MRRDYAAAGVPVLAEAYVYGRYAQLDAEFHTGCPGYSQPPCACPRSPPPPSWRPAAAEELPQRRAVGCSVCWRPPGGHL